MAISYMDYTAPGVQFTYDLSKNNFFTKDAANLINALSVKQLNTLGNVSLLDIYLSKANVIEPHYHQNASELVYCISGSAVVSILNPFTKELLNFPIAPGQVANVPQGWWHYEMATADSTHLLAIFDAPVPEFIPGSDLLRLTPPGVLAYTYCLDEAKVKETLAPITQTVVIGPPANCQPSQVAGASTAMPAAHANAQYPGVGTHPAQQPYGHAPVQPYAYQAAAQPYGQRPYGFPFEPFANDSQQDYANASQQPYENASQPTYGYGRQPCGAPVIGNGWAYGYQGE